MTSANKQQEQEQKRRSRSRSSSGMNVIQRKQSIACSAHEIMSTTDDHRSQIKSQRNQWTIICDNNNQQQKKKKKSKMSTPKLIIGTKSVTYCLYLSVMMSIFCICITRAQNAQNSVHTFFTYSPDYRDRVLNVNNQQLSAGNNERVMMRPTIEQMASLIEPLVEPPTDQYLQSSASMISTQDQSSLPSIAINSQSSQQHQQQQCQMPITWAGKWYQRGSKDAIKVSHSGISDKGVCRERKGDKFLLENRTTRCLVCMVIIERHLNVLQYKESPADCQHQASNSVALSSSSSSSDQSSLLDRLCAEIAGDAQLDTLFRIDTPPIECPILGRFAFTYDNCKDPQSSLESCTDRRQLNFRFNACPDVPGSEVKTEVLKCYADWTEGSNFYMIGRLESASNGADRGKFRCYMYERTSDGYLMSQSQDESCDGLFSAQDGPRSMKISARIEHESRCQFPSYLNEQENWLHVDNSLIYMFGGNSSTYQVKETKEGNIIEESTCIRQVRSSSSMLGSNLARSSLSSVQSYDQFIVQTTKNCQTLNYCIRIYRRAAGLIQIEFYHHNQQHDECTASSKPSFTITLTNAEHQPCPFNGAFSVIAPADSDLTYNPSNIFMCPRQSLLVSQCDDPTRISVHSRCTTKIMTKHLYCQGSWTYQHVTRLLLSDDDRQRYFLTYRESSQQIDTRQLTLDNHYQQPQPQQQQIIEMSILPIIAPRTTTSTQLAPIRPTTVRLARRGSCHDIMRQSATIGLFSATGIGSPPPVGVPNISPIDASNSGFLGAASPNNIDLASSPSSATSIGGSHFNLLSLLSSSLLLLLSLRLSATYRVC